MHTRSRTTAADDGFTMRHSYPPVQIGASAGSVAGGAGAVGEDRRPVPRGEHALR